ncbi:MAG: 3-phosphoshikimate 1-carboxyvinyltransferase [Gammaproteobacteria bacterium]|nr:3-phosphoshikimate 1-carboxyvinyltransferase [Gammaproteobacteria bacterium]
MAEAASICSSPVRSLRGELRVPGDKSISHRALMLAAVARGDSEIVNFLESADCLATLAALRALGADIKRTGEGRVAVRGGGLRACAQPLDLGNSGTAMRLLAGLLAGQGVAGELRGDESLSRRPMRRIVEPLRAMGADISAAPGGTPPLRIHAAGPLRGIRRELPVASAQVKSCLLLAALGADGATTVTEPSPSRDHTERMLPLFGCPVSRGGGAVSVEGGARLRGARIEAPADISSAAFFIVAASIAADADLTLTGVGVNPTRTGVIDILRRMGADIEISGEHTLGNEPAADVRVRSARLRGVEIGPQWVARAIDEWPVLFIAAACADGVTRVRGAAELRAKESDRIAAMARGLRACGIAVETFDDGLAVEGGRLRGADVEAFGDHRIAMAFAVAGAAADGDVRIAGCANIATSFPGFAAAAAQAGLNLDTAR